VSSLLRFLGLSRPAAAHDAETETVRRIAERLERLEPAAARHLAAFAYVLARVAHADLAIDADETAAMVRIVETNASLSPEEATLAVEIAKSQTRLLSGTENYVVTREFRRIASPEQRAELLHCVFAVAAADGTISSPESAEIAAIGEELGFSRAEINGLRAAHRDRLSELRDLPSRER
jgi:uncharacterized tellurite resistance protein B-like protein